MDVIAYILAKNAGKQAAAEERARAMAAEAELQGEIDLIEARSDVVDVVADYAALKAYDKSTLSDNDIIKVLKDETRADVVSYYRFIKNDNDFVFVGSLEPYYTKTEIDILLAAEKQARENADSVLEHAINAEKVRAEEAESALSEAIEQESADRIAAVEAEQSARIATDNILSGQIAEINTEQESLSEAIQQEVVRATAEEGILAGKIDDTEDHITELRNDVFDLIPGDTSTDNKLTNANELSGAIEALQNDNIYHMADFGAVGTEINRIDSELDDLSVATDHYVTATSDGNIFASEEALIEASTLYIHGNNVAREELTLGDYAVVLADNEGKTSRYAWTLVSRDPDTYEWVKQYVINNDANEATARQTIASDLASEITRATSAEGTLASDLANEVARATGAEEALTERLNNLDLAETGAAGSYIKLISQEDGLVSATAQAFDTSFENTSNDNAPTSKLVKDNIDELQGAIDTEEATRQNEITRVEGLVSAEATSRAEADTAINNRIDALDYTGTLTSSETVSTIIQEDGLISISKQNIQIAQSQVTDLDTRLKKVDDPITGSVAVINSKIPEAASDNNQLADKAFVTEAINSVAAYYITYTAAGEAFPTHAALLGATVVYSGGEVRIPTRNDYCIVLADEDQKDEGAVSAPTTRYTYQGNEWQFQYRLDSAGFTADQLAAINSGVTENFVTTIPVRLDTIEGKIPAEASSANMLADKAYVDTKASTISTALADEIARAKAAEATEKSRAEAAEAALSEDVDAAETAAKAYADELVEALDLENPISNSAGKTVATISEANGIVSATFQNIEIAQSQVIDLAEDLAGLESSLKTYADDAVAAEAAERGRADGVLATDITTVASDLSEEITTARAAEEELTTAIANEVTAREQAISAVDSKIDTEVARATRVESDLDAAIKAEEVRAKAAEATKTTTEIISAEGRALIFNESDGGGAKFEHKDGTNSFVGVNNGGKDGIAVQLYVIDKDNSADGVKINLEKGRITYIKNKATSDRTDADEIAVKGDFADYATEEYVDAAIRDLPEPMIFKGSLGVGGTISSLPEASSENEGFTYKVITAGTYAEQTAKVGDTFISDGTTWVLIPSGDEPTGTVTSVGLSVPTGLEVSNSPVTSAGTINVDLAEGYVIPTEARLSDIEAGIANITDGSEINSFAETEAALATKQEAIDDLQSIREGAALGATSIQSGDNISELVNDAGYLTRHQDISNKTDRLLHGQNGNALIFNESDGGGAKFEHNDGTWSFVGVNDGGESGITGQIYSIKENEQGKKVGTRLNLTTNGFFYTNGNDNASFTNDDELATVGTVDAKVADVQATIDAIGPLVQELQESKQDVIDESNKLPYSLVDGTPVLAEVATSGSYNDLSDTPVIPEIPENVSAFINDAGYITAADVLPESVYIVNYNGPINRAEIIKAFNDGKVVLLKGAAPDVNSYAYLNYVNANGYITFIKYLASRHGTHAAFNTYYLNTAGKWDDTQQATNLVLNAVQANPAAEASTYLEKVTVKDTTYAIPSATVAKTGDYNDLLNIPEQEYATADDIAELFPQIEKASTPTEVRAALASNEVKYVELADDVVSTGSFNLIGTDKILNLNNNTLRSTNNTALNVVNGATLTIEGEGEVQAQEFGIVALSGSEVVINGGTFTTTDNCVLGTNGSTGYGGNTIIINDGVFNGHITSSGYIACGIHAANNDHTIINGGTFNIYDGCGICIRSGVVEIPDTSKVTFNMLHEHASPLVEGKVGDSKVNVPVDAVYVLDFKSAYPGGDPAIILNGITYNKDNIEAARSAGITVLTA